MNITDEMENCTFLTEQDHQLLSIAKFWLEGVVQMSLAVLGVLTNMVSIYVLSRKELTNTFNQLLIVLAIFDILYLCLAFIDCIGQVFYYSLYMERPEWYELLTPYLLYPGKAIFLTCSVFMMISIAVERYTAVFYPFSRIPISTTLYFNRPCFKKRLCVYILPVIFLSIVLNIFKFLESNIGSKDGKVVVNITELRLHPIYLQVNSWVRFMLLGVLPLTVIIFLNCCIYWAVRRARIERYRRQEDRAILYRTTDQTHSQRTRLLVRLGSRVRWTSATSRDLERVEISTSEHKAKGGDCHGSFRRESATKGNKVMSASEQRLSVVLIMIAVIFILSSLPRITIMMYDLIIIDTLRSCIDAGHLGEGFPLWNHLLGYISHVLLSVVPSANFLVYCLVGNKFRRVASIYLRRVFTSSPAARPVLLPQPGSLRSSTRVTAVPARPQLSDC